MGIVPGANHRSISQSSLRTCAYPAIDIDAPTIKLLSPTALTVADLCVKGRILEGLVSLADRIPLNVSLRLPLTIHTDIIPVAQP